MYILLFPNTIYDNATINTSTRPWVTMHFTSQWQKAVCLPVYFHWFQFNTCRNIIVHLCRYEDAQAALDKRTRSNAGSGGRAKNVVLFLGDGMSVPTLAAARTLLGQREGRSGEEAELSFESFPTVGLAKVHIAIQKSYHSEKSRLMKFGLY